MEIQTNASTTTQVAKSAGSVGIAVFFSRILGLVREQVMAALFGAGFYMDAFVVAFRIPNLLRDLFAEGALSAAFVTVFTDYDQKKGQEAAWRLANNVLLTLTVLLSLITLLGMIFSKEIIQVMASNFGRTAGKIALTQLLTNIMFPFLIMVSLAAAVMGMLNAKGRFFIPAMASTFFNMGSIVGGVLCAWWAPAFGQPPIVGMAVGTLIGGILQLAIQLPSLKRSGFAWRPHIGLKDEGLRRIMILMIPAVIGLSATQINIFINTNFAARCAEGSVSWLNYAFRLMQFPIGIFGVAIAIATLPVISRQASQGDIGALKATYVSSLTMAFLMTIPASFGLAFLAKPIIRLIFEHGRFTSIDTLHTAEALAYYSVGLFAYSTIKITVPVFYALKDTKYPVISSFLAVVTNVLFISLALDAFQHKAIAFSTSITMIINFVFLSAVLYKKVGGYDLRYLIGAFIKITLASLAMGLLAYYLYPIIGQIMDQRVLLNQIISLMVAITLAVLVYFVLIRLLGIKEYQEVLGSLKRRYSGKI
ncbi:MAG: murein biosynthesis integral membrane protein MurJ [Deltaproteobacteria bacterium RBG_13_52_11]|nr:MAG: murein biosynthesis integral membrane protein MurJ [Deltaproteobacteria bacterium RBG_13_52_11]